MARESYIERESGKRILRLGAFAYLKIGWEGWPDRLVLFGHNLHCWMEFKQEKGRLRAVQEERIRQMREHGEVVYTPRSVAEAVASFEEAKRAIQRPETRAGE